MILSVYAVILSNLGAMCYVLRLPEVGLPKFIVYKTCLAELLECCPQCGLSCAVTWSVIGRWSMVARRCVSGTASQW